MEPEQSLALVDRHSAWRDQLREQLAAFVASRLRALPESAWYQSGVSEIVAQVRTAQQAIGSMTWQYLDLLGNPARGSLVLPADLRGRQDRDVWERPFKVYRYQRSLGATHEAAVQAAVDRAATIVDDDLTLAMRESARRHAQATPGVIGLRRVIHPEMSKGGVCGLCIAASDRVYSVRRLLPVHGHCRCTVAEVTKKSDPGSSLNSMSLDDLYRTAGGTGWELKATRYQVNEHGELGPVLAPKSTHWRGPRDVKADEGVAVDPAVKAGRRVTALSKSIRDLEERAISGEDVSVQLKHQRDLLSRLRREAS